MGRELENPQAFLTDAQIAVAEYQTALERLSAQREQEKQLERDLEALRRETREKIERTVRARGEEIAATYNRQLSQIDTKLRRVQQQRDRAKSQGIKGRISAETEELRQENKDLRRQLAAILKKDGAPVFCRTGLFYTLFRPGSLPELLGLLLAFLFFFAVIPIGIYLFLLPERRTLWFSAVYLVDILFFGGLYVLIGNRTNGKHAAALRQGQEIRKRIRLNRRSIRGIIRGIRGDASEEGYHLEEYDDELARGQQDRSEVIAKKQSAQNTFESVTKNIITDEIETAGRPRAEELAEKLREAQSLRAELERDEKERAILLSRDYEQYLGKTHMNEKDIGRIRDMLVNGQAVSLIDAVTKLDTPLS